MGPPIPVKVLVGQPNRASLYLESAVLRLVQAGVSSGADSITFSQTQRELGFELFGGHKWSPGEIHTTLPDEGKKGCPLTSLTAALQYLIKAKFLFTIELQRGKNLAWDGASLFQVVGTRFFSRTLRLCFSPKAMNKRWVTPSSQAGLEQVLSRRCYACPVPLRLDGRVLNGPVHDACAGVGYIPHQETLKGTLIGFLTVNVRAKMQPSYLVWTHHGVIVKREELRALGAWGSQS